MKILAAQMKHKQRRLFWVNLEQPPTCSKFTQNNLCLCFICAANIFICGASVFVPGDVIAYNSMSNILKHRSSKNKTFTGTNKRDYLEYGGGDLRMTYKYYFVSKKPKQHKQNVLQHKRLRLFWHSFALDGGQLHGDL